MRGSPRAETRFLVEATSTRNEDLTVEISAESVGEAMEQAIHEFRCEGHSVLSATASEIVGEEE
jgi:hypothetical protein